MAAVADELVILIRAEVGKAVAGIDKVGKRTESAGNKAKKAGKKFKDAGKKMSMMATLPIAAFIGSSVKKFNEQEKAIAEVNSTIESMGVAWTTTADLQKRAADLQAQSTFGDEEILHMQSVLLTFGDITEDVFRSTEQVALDMSAALGQDLQSSAVMLGKALNDPIVGLSALSRVGVSFSEDQKDMIKAMAEGGDMIGAQTLMMEALESQFAGTAKEISETSGGKMKQAMNSFGDTMETVGGIVAPILLSIIGFIGKLVGWFDNLPGPVQKVIVGLVLLVAAIGPILYIGGLVLTLFGALSTVFGAVAGAVALISLPVLAVVAAIAAAIAIGWLIYKNWDTIFAFLKSIVETTWEAIKGVFSMGVEFIKTLVMTVFNAIKAYFVFVFNLYKTIITTTINVIKTVIETVINAIWETIKFVFNAIKAYFIFVFNLYKTIITTAIEFIKTAVVNGFNWVKDTITSIWNKVAAFIKEVLGRIKATIIRVIEGVKTNVRRIFRGMVAVVKGIWNGLTTFFTTRLENMKTNFLRIFNLIKDKGTAIWESLASGMKGAIKGAVNGIINSLNAVIRGMNVMIRGANVLNPFSDIPNIPTIPNLGFGGTDLGGTFTVGDRGKPEVVTLPQGSSVTPLTGAGAGAGGGINIHLNAPQNDPHGVAMEIGWELTKRGR